MAHDLVFDQTEKTPIVARCGKPDHHGSNLFEAARFV
jgi:hypothetical protein